MVADGRLCSYRYYGGHFENRHERQHHLRHLDNWNERTMDIGGLCAHEIKIQTNRASADDKAGAPESWQIRYANVRALIQPLSAREQAKWSGLPTIATHRIYIGDGSLSISEDDRILYENRVFRILGVRNPDELGYFLVLDCEELR